MTGEQLRKKRERLGISQGKCGQLLGVTRQTMWRWEQGLVEIPPLKAPGIEAALDRYGAAQAKPKKRRSKRARLSKSRARQIKERTDARHNDAGRDAARDRARRRGKA